MTERFVDDYCSACDTDPCRCAPEEETPVKTSEHFESCDTWCCPHCYESGPLQLTQEKEDGENIVRCGACQERVGTLRED